MKKSTYLKKFGFKKPNLSIFLGGADSPGSEKTKNPWEADGASRRSSLSTKPEVMVTGSDGDQNAQNGAGVGKTPMPKLMSLLPVSYKRSYSILKGVIF